MARVEQLALRLTETIATYMQVKFQHQTHGNPQAIPFPQEWDITLLQECDLAVAVLIEASCQRISTQWSAEDYVSKLTERCTGRNPRAEQKLLREFPPIHSPTVFTMTPCLITDCEGKHLMWYLPGILTTQRTTQMWNDMKYLSPSIRINKNATSWRISPMFFRAETGWLTPGNVSMSPAWFQQAHEKSHQMEVSKELTKNQNLTWVQKQLRASAIVGGILSIIHPELFQAGIKALKLMSTHPGLVTKGDRLHDILRVWSSPFSVVSVISNRQTPFHRDNGSAHQWFDILVPLGNYKNGRLELPGLGMRFKYDAGTVVALTGRVLRHGATCPGDRACLAFYMRHQVINTLGVPLPSWACM